MNNCSINSGEGSMFNTTMKFDLGDVVIEMRDMVHR